MLYLKRETVKRDANRFYRIQLALFFTILEIFSIFSSFESKPGRCVWQLPILRLQKECVYCCVEKNKITKYLHLNENIQLLLEIELCNLDFQHSSPFQNWRSLG